MNYLFWSWGGAILGNFQNSGPENKKQVQQNRFTLSVFFSPPPQTSFRGGGSNLGVEEVFFSFKVIHTG